ncbi:hypothetical protein SAMD00019534_056770 [Acytostelium subglobosum LB1]|uniref:hypothetical protein n=1 Tax=Acytostelium subglobosum LB1 TaxID=1410327 RepID=UPI0006449141|nr:hypothetical protein SAMD00019534_056770 [Acytostelium subglobosum LB1]GAM22502.1 hypothetical protein SAMD00019534_056770 [Acytostelium subglobosum LB1]|eukprot:XP_012754622.1 hypothetical protein SAMD00019534_056770 [Acytostelium subglobosum LB1]
MPKYTADFPLALQRILDTITPIVLKCTTNQSVCCNSNLIYHLRCCSAKGKLRSKLNSSRMLVLRSALIIGRPLF